MPTHEQQPEEAATRVPAAAVSAAGSFAQVRMYGRGSQQRADSKARSWPEHNPARQEEQSASAAPRGETEAGAGQPSVEEVPELPPATDLLGDPGTPADETGASIEGNGAGELAARSSAGDVAAAQARLARGQLEPPVPGPRVPVQTPLPGMGPGL